MITCENFIVRTHFFDVCLFVCLLINVSREGERSSVRDFSVILDLGDVWHNKNVKLVQRELVLKKQGWGMRKVWPASKILPS
jgi:hypothetical protein